MAYNRPLIGSDVQAALDASNAKLKRATQASITSSHSILRETERMSRPPCFCEPGKCDHTVKPTESGLETNRGPLDG
jgi:hypothetical protein